MMQDFDPSEAAKLFGEYGRLFKKINSQSKERIYTPEYRKLLKLQEYLMNLTGKQIIEAAEHYEEIFNYEDLENSSPYIELKNTLSEKNEELTGKLSKKENELRSLKSKLEKIVSPFREVIKFLDEK